MADEILKRDANNEPVMGLVTDDSSLNIKMARIDDTTKGLKVVIVGGIGTGTVTSLTAGTGITLSPSPITTTGSISLANTAVTAGLYTLANITVDAQGRITSASNGSAGAGTVTSVSVTTANGVSGVVATATTTPAITLTLGAITPTSVNGNVFTTGSSTYTGTAGQTYTFPTTTATIARTDAGQTFTGVQNFTSPDTTTSITTATTSFTAWAGATTLLTIGGTGASASLFAPSTLDTSSSITGAIRTSGGISAAKAANIGTTLTVGTGYQIGGAAASGKILIGNGTNYVASTPTYPNVAGTAGNVLTSDGTNIVSSAPAGATISVTALQTGSARDLLVTNNVSTFAGATTQNDFGKVTTNKKIGIGIIGSGVSMTTMTLALLNVGSPVDNVSIRIETDNTDAPSGSLADANATASVTSGSLSGAFQDTTITFAGAFTLTSGTRYWIVLYRSGAESDANYYSTGNSASLATYSLTEKEVNGGSWGASSYNNFYYSGTGFITGGAILNKSATLSGIRVLGFATANYTAGGTVTITPIGQIATGFSSLQPGYNYIASATPGAITLGAIGATANIVAVAITATTLLVTVRVT